MDISDRIKELRTSLRLTQAEFGDHLGIGRAAVGAIENRVATVTDRNIQLLSKQFAVSEEWLRTGEGDMFSALQDDLDYLVGMYGDKVTPNIRAIVEMMLTLDDAPAKAV